VCVALVGGACSPTLSDLNAERPDPNTARPTSKVVLEDPSDADVPDQPVSSTRQEPEPTATVDRTSLPERLEQIPFPKLQTDRLYRFAGELSKGGSQCAAAMDVQFFSLRTLHPDGVGPCTYRRTEEQGYTLLQTACERGARDVLGFNLGISNEVAIGGARDGCRTADGSLASKRTGRHEECSYAGSVCDQGLAPPNDHDAEERPGLVTARPFPHAPSGFKLGISPDQFSKACKSLGGFSVGGGHLHCVGVPHDPLPEYVVFAKFCSNRLCEVGLAFEGGLSDYTTVSVLMTERYGLPDSQPAATNGPCETGGLPALEWTWIPQFAETEPGHAQVLAGCFRENDQRPLVSLTYRTPQGLAAVTAAAIKNAAAAAAAAEAARAPDDWY